MNRIVINDVRDIDLEHIFECGQCFRWVPAGDGTGDYTGAAGKYAARVMRQRIMYRMRESTG